MKYIGEHLLPGEFGHFFALLALSASLVATLSFYFTYKTKDFLQKQSWLRIARTAFAVETVSVIAIIGCIYYILANHLFEYKYAWEHSDKTLQLQYVFSCLWEGQEGSFLLWTFWHCVLGWLIIWRVKRWEAPVMTVISFAQFCLATMLLGIYIFNVKVGSNPFVLLRNEGLLDDAPFFRDINTGGIRADYLSVLKDGSGLNALLQNYWMVIHPPILFLGFASTVVPFAFAYAGLVTKDQSWVKSVMPWALFSMAVVGLGIMMGAAWAYESLTFGGYWAWDPVENASLVPWLIMVAGVHTALIYRHSGYSLKSTYLFFTLAFLLVLYETFLTRSGILGDTSVHAFTSAGMNGQLLLFLSVFTWLPPFVKAKRNGKLIIAGLVALILVLSLFLHENVVAGIWLFSLLGFVVAFGIQLNQDTSIPTIHKEESTYSREFWMFIGALVFFLSAVLIISQTSLPVINKVFDKKMAESEDAEFSYNRIQVFIAIIIGVLTAVIQYLKYKNTNRQFFIKKIAVPTIIALIISVLISVFGNINYDKKGFGFLGAIHVAIFAAVYSVVANASYIWLGFKGNVKRSGAAIAHVGFGLVLLGILISSSKKEILSWNTTGISTLPDTEASNKIVGKPAENTTLFRGIATDMGKYDVTYTRDTLNDINHKKYFEVHFKSKGGIENFNVYPDVMHNTKGQDGFAPNPSSKHYWNRDIFVYVTSWLEGSQQDTATFRPIKLKQGDTSFYSNGIIIFKKVEVNKPDVKGVQPGETSMVLDLQVIGKNGSRYGAFPGVAIQNDSAMRSLPDTVVAQNLVLRFNRIADAKNGEFEIGVKESNELSDLLTLKVLQFPFINLLWIGVMVTVIGTLMSMAKYVGKKPDIKVQENKVQANKIKINKASSRI